MKVARISIVVLKMLMEHWVF